MQREEKQLEMLIDAVLNRLQDLKNSIRSMIHKLETEFATINWPSFLDNFALISSHLTGLSKILAQEIGPGLRNLTVLPLQLTQERDDALWQLTEGRIPIFSHDLVPDYLRTKSEPAAEAKIVQYESKANSINPEKLVTQYTKVISHAWEMLNKAREDWDLEASNRGGIQQSSSQHDTQLLVAAVGMGKGLKQINMLPMGGPMGAIRPPSMGAVSPVVGGKIPSAIKTNIKSANQIHPYRLLT